MTAAGVLTCGGLAARANPDTRGAAEAGQHSAENAVPRAHVILWFLLAGCAVVLLMGVTNELCLNVASVRFLWILPLSVYLVTFILCFGGGRAYRRSRYLGLAGVALAVPVVIGMLGGNQGWLLAVGGIASVPDRCPVPASLRCLHGAPRRAVWGA